MATLPYSPPLYDPAYLERAFEAGQQLGQDADRAGFQNFSNVRDVYSINSSSSQFINAKGGNDVIQLFGTADDTVYGGSGDDTVFGGAGNDTIWGQADNDTLIGFDGRDKLYGGSGRDNLEGGFGQDELYGGTGNDELWGGDGADIMYGGADNDQLFGDGDGGPGPGNDIMSGGYGNDTLEGGGGADQMWGDSGADTFVFRTAADLSIGQSDRIMDFSHANGDRIDLSLMDARLGAGGVNDTFQFVNGPSAQSGRVWLGNVSADGVQSVFMNIDADAAADIEIFVFLADNGDPPLVASDFIL